MKTPYEILGVHRRADDATIRAALRRTAKRYHPDLHAEDPEAEQHLKEAIAAYQMLKNPQKRAAYDRYLRRRTQRTGRLLRTALASGGTASTVVIALIVWLWKPLAPDVPGLDQKAAAEETRTPGVADVVAAPDPGRIPTRERVASGREAQAPAAAEPTLLVEWGQIAGKGDPLAVWAFAARNPRAPEAELAGAWLLLHMEATEDVSFLKLLRADAGGILAQHAQQRLDALARPVRVAARREDGMGVAAEAEGQADASPKGAAFYLERGVRRVGFSDLDRAIADLSEAIRIEPGNAAAHRHRAGAWGRKGDHDKALADYETAIRIDPGNAVALRDRGALWRRIGATELALRDLDRAIRLGFSDAAAYIERGRVWLDKANYERAIADFNQAIKLDPGLAGAYFNRAVALHGKGDLHAASVDLKVALSLAPSMAALFPPDQR